MMRRLLAVVLGATTFTGAAAAWELVGSFRCPVANARGYARYALESGWTVSGGPTPYVYYIAPEVSTIISSFPAPGGAGAWGVASDLGYGLFLSNNQTSWIYEMTTAGSLYRSFQCPVPGPADPDVRVIRDPFT